MLILMWSRAFWARYNIFMVFSDRKFIVICDQTESIKKHDALCELIRANNGEIVNWDERADVDVSPKLIIVSNTMDYDRSEEMKRFMIPTVTPRWVHCCVREQKLVPTRPFSPDPRNFMRDVIACFSGLSKGDTDVSKAGIVASGGECTDMVTRYTTHVIATSLQTPECELVLESKKNNPQIGIKLVRPSWVDACMSLQVKVDDTPYLLNAESNTSEETQDLTATYPVNDSPRLAVQQSMRDDLGSNTLDGRKIFLSEDLDLSERVSKTVTYLIETNGGVITKDLAEAQVYLGKWREGENYITASRRKIIIGNITWLYWVLIHQHFEKPTHLLHYPEVKGGLAAMKDCNICVTNYTGDARAYLVSLVHSLGANYSGKLIEHHTTHLITAYESGQKYEAAKKWGIPVVNHLWLEDSYAYWQPQDPLNRVYTYFPSKLSMSTLIGTRNLVANVLSKFQNPDAEFSKPPHPKRQAKQKAGNWLHDAMIVENEFHQKLRRGKLPIEDAEASKEAPKEVTNTPQGASRSSSPGHSKTTNNDNHPINSSGDAEIGTPRGNPSSTPRKATQNTPKGTPQSISRNQESRDHIDDTHTGVSSDPPSDRVDESHSGEPKTNNNSISPRATPPPKSSSVPPTSVPGAPKEKHRIMFSGVDEPPSNKACGKIGLSVVKAHPVEILVAPKFMKTAKFLQCLAETQEFVKPEWIEACISSNSLLPTDKYRIDDEQLSLALKNREALGGRPLFEGMKLKLAPDCRDQMTSFKTFVKAHGGFLVTSNRDEDVVVVGNEDSDDVPWAKFIESMQLMDRKILQS